MRTSIATLITGALAVAILAVGNWAWFTIPAGVPVNYLGLDGHRHIENSRAVFLIIPLVAAAVAVGLTFAAARTQAAVKAAVLFDALRISVMGVLLTAEAAMVQRALDAQANVMRPTAIATGVLLLAVGNYLGKARQNSVIGIKTPWTLANATVWDKTHRFAGRGMVLGGLLLIVLGFVLRDGNALGVSIGVCTALPLLAAVVRSAGLHRALQRG
jgi:uncharacterized membrane protein